MPKLRFMVLFILSIFPLMTYAQDGSLQIIASHSILGDVVANVVGDVSDVQLIMPVGADPHSFEATPTDLTALATADVVFTNGAFFEEGLLESIENASADVNIVEASQCVEIIPIGATSHDHEEDEDHDHEGEEAEDHDHDHDADTDVSDPLCEQHIAEFDSYHEGLHDHEEGEDHDHEEEAEEGEEHHHSEVEALGRLYAIDCGAGHDEHEDEGEEGEEHHHEAGSCDPHVWMEPHNVMYWTMMIRDTLIELDPDHADAYQANADAYLDQLNTLIHDELMPLVETLPEENRILITNHDAFGYFAAAYDFELVGTIIPGGSTLAEPSVQDIAELIDAINSEGVPAVFAETTVNTSIAETIADETGAQLVILYSGSLSEPEGDAGTYIDYIRYNYHAIVNALSN